MSTCSMMMSHHRLGQVIVTSPNLLCSIAIIKVFSHQEVSFIEHAYFSNENHRETHKSTRNRIDLMCFINLFKIEFIGCCQLVVWEKVCEFEQSEERTCRFRKLPTTLLLKSAIKTDDFSANYPGIRCF